MHTESKLHFFARCREVLRRRHKKPFHALERPPEPVRVERLEPRYAPAVTGTVSGTTVNLSGDNGADTYSFGVSGGGNLTHTFPTGGGGFESNEDFDSKMAGVQTVKADKTADVKIDDSGGSNSISFEGLPNAVTVGGVSSNAFATSDSGRFSFSGIESITGTPQGDNISFRTGFELNLGNAQTISINGGGGNDTVEITGNDNVVIDGGAGNDSIVTKNKAAATINSGDGNDTIVTQTARTVIDGGKDNDLIQVKDKGDVSETTIAAGDGNDTVTSAADKATIDGGGGKDNITITSGKKSTVKISGGDDDDTINGSAAPATIDGGKGNDLINGGKGDQSINGGDGEDTVIPGKGKNTVVGGNGNDSVIGSAKTILEEGGGSFALTDTSLMSTVGGMNFVDAIQGVKQVVLMGSPLGDKIDVSGFSFATTIGGSAGDDELIGGPTGSVLAVNLGAGDSSTYVLQPTLGTGQGLDTLSNIDGAVVSITDTTGHFFDASGFRLGGITLNGGDGNDTVALANDLKIFNVINTAAGNDLILLGASRSKIDGGLGTDTVGGGALFHAGVTFVSNGASGNATTKNFNERSKLVNVSSRIVSFEVFEGSKMDDVIKVTSLRNAILQVNGGAGNDKISGGGRGTLEINGGDGDDIVKVSAPPFIDHKVFGGKGNDKLTVSGPGGGFLFGEDGNDVLTNNAFGGLDGGMGDDTLVSGGRGNNISGGAGADLVKAGGGNDIVDIADGSGTDTADGGSGSDILSSDSGDTTKNFP